MLAAYVSGISFIASVKRNQGDGNGIKRLWTADRKDLGLPSPKAKQSALAVAGSAGQSRTSKLPRRRQFADDRGTEGAGTPIPGRGFWSQQHVGRQGADQGDRRSCADAGFSTGQLDAELAATRFRPRRLHQSQKVQG